MNLWNKLSGKVTELLSQTDVEKLLKRGLAPLDSLQAGMSERCCAFVFEGRAPETLLGLALLSNAGQALGHPGAVWGHLHQLSKAQRQAAEACIVARDGFFKLAIANGLPSLVLVRLGKVLEAADQKANLLRTQTSAPDWLYYLMTDMLLRRVHGNWARMEDAAKGRATQQLRLTCQLIEQLLSADDLDPNIAAQVLFERKGADSYAQSAFDPLLSLADMDDYLQRQRELIATLPKILSAPGRVALLTTIATKSRAANFSALICHLAVDSAKAVREPAAAALSLLLTADVEQHLQQLLHDGGSAGERAQAADLISRRLGDGAQELLQAAAENESSKPVLEAIERALSRTGAATDHAALKLPVPPPFPQLDDQPLGAEALAVLELNLQELLETAKRAVEQEERENAKEGTKYSWARENLTNLKKLSSADLQREIDRINGQGKHSRRSSRDALVLVVEHKERLAGLTGMSLSRLLVQMAGRGGQFEYYFSFSNPALNKWLDAQPAEALDLRCFAQAFAKSKLPIRVIAGACLIDNYQGVCAMDRLPAERIWPFFAEHMEWLREGLGMSPSTAERYREFELGMTLRVLGTFPVLPTEFIPRLLELALGEAKTNRQGAQELLQQLPDIGDRVLHACSSSKQELRIVAISWLAQLNHRQTAPALRKLLNKERKETVRAALLSTLEHFGEDTSQWLNPTALGKEASKGVASKLPAAINWFDFAALPAARWADGKPVAPDIPRWWVVLACKLKAPGGNALLERYLGLLERDSAAAVGRVVLSQFIAQDTRCPTLQEANAFAEQHADQRLAMYKQWAQHSPEYAAYTRERIYVDLRQEHLGNYLGSAIAAKGILALISAVAGHELASTVGNYMRDHFIRRAQIEALLEAIACSDDPAAMQLLMAVSRRHRTASVQAKALALVDLCAQRLGWSADELADRTMPSAGLDESGVLQLSYGKREFSVRLDDAMKPVLRNAEGKLIKALPQPRLDEEATVVKESKAQFSAAKKEIKQVISLQSGRLYEAMCAQREWPVAQWQEFLQSHPIVGRLCQRLIWRCRTDADQARSVLFRPAEDGSLLDPHDDEVTPPENAFISLAHGALIDAESVGAWNAHLKDYKIKALFAQLDRQSPELDTTKDQSEVIDRVGWCADAFTLRGAFNKLGYQRGQAEDGGCFYEYSKSFTSLGINVIIEFSGSYLPEENVAAALKGLSFRRRNQGRYAYTPMALSKVPQVLLAESYADYLQVAASGSGFDAAWESKMPW